MAEGDQSPADRPPDFRASVEASVAGLVDAGAFAKYKEWFVDALVTALSKVVEGVLRVGGSLGVLLARSIARGEDASGDVFGELAEVAIEDMFGVKVARGAMNKRGNRGGRQAAADAIGSAMMDAFSAQATRALGGEIGPSDAPARAFLSSMTQLALEGWLEGWLVEALSVGQIETFGDLDDTISHILGLGRASASVHGPLVKHFIVDPLEWKILLEHRPTALGQAAAIEAHLAGRLSLEALHVELSRLGYSDERIEALVDNARKRLSFPDLVYQVSRGVLSDADAIARAADLGYDATTARELLDLEFAKRTDRYRDPLVDAAVEAYIAREITEAELRDVVNATAPNQQEASFIILAAITRRGYRPRRLSAGDVRRLVEKRILSVIDYRLELEREGYRPADVAALELELRADLAKTEATDALRDQQRRERELEDAARQAAADARRAELAERQATPALGEYRRAYVRGIISRDDFGAAVRRDMVGISSADLVVLLEDADVDRSAFLEREDAAAAARARKPDPALPLDVYEASVVRKVLTREQYARELVARGYDDAEQTILLAALDDRLARAAETAAAKAAAEQRADAKAISLGDFERAVRLGVRSLAEYSALLARLDTPQVAAALLVDVLAAQLEEDARTRETRAAREAAAAERGISLAQRRRAVVSGVRPRAYYADALAAAGWSTEDQRVELELVDQEIAAAAADRARRDQIAAEQEAARAQRQADAEAKAQRDNEPPPAPTLSIAQFERAVKLGLLPPDALRAELEARGYGVDDVELLVALVVATIPDTAAAETREAAIADELAARQVSLADLQRAVLRGFQTLEQYGDALAARGYGADDVLLLVELLRDRAVLAWSSLRDAIRARLEKIEDAPTLDEILEALDAGDVDGATVRTILEGYGVDAPTALLFVRMAATFGTEA